MELHENKIINCFILAGNTEEESNKLYETVHRYFDCIEDELEMAYRINAVVRGTDIGTASAEQIAEAIASCKGLKFIDK